MFKFEFTGKLVQLNSSLGWNYIVFIPIEYLHHFSVDKAPRVVATFNHEITSHISVKTKADDRFLVVKTEIRKKLNLTDDSTVHVKIEKDESKYGMPMPVELKEMLEQEPIANEYFHALTPGKQRSLIYIVSQLKNPDPRIKKALGIVEHLKEEKGKLDFRLLQEKFKEINQRFL